MLTTDFLNHFGDHWCNSLMLLPRRNFNHFNLLPESAHFRIHPGLLKQGVFTCIVYTVEISPFFVFIETLIAFKAL